MKSLEEIELERPQALGKHILGGKKKGLWGKTALYRLGPEIEYLVREEHLAHTNVGLPPRVGVAFLKHPVGGCGSAFFCIIHAERGISC